MGAIGDWGIGRLSRDERKEEGRVMKMGVKMGNCERECLFTEGEGT